MYGKKKQTKSAPWPSRGRTQVPLRRVPMRDTEADRLVIVMKAL
jgi:hypothetical protein